MSTSVVVADWIKRVADDERKRDAVRVREEEMAARKADLVASTVGDSLTNSVRRSRVISRPSGTSLQETARATLSWKRRSPKAGSWFLRRNLRPSSSRSPDLEAAAMGCHDRFMRTNELAIGIDFVPADA